MDVMMFGLSVFILISIFALALFKQIITTVQYFGLCLLVLVTFTILGFGTDLMQIPPVEFCKANGFSTASFTDESNPEYLDRYMLCSSATDSKYYSKQEYKQWSATYEWW